MKKNITIFAVVLAGFIGASASAHAYQCKTSPTQANATHHLKATAYANSKANWSNIVKGSYGLSWSVWDIAQAKSGNCHKLANGKWNCLASAKPCNYVVP